MQEFAFLSNLCRKSMPPKSLWLLETPRNRVNCEEGRHNDSWLQLIKLTDAQAHFSDANHCRSVHELKTPFSRLVITALIPSSVIIPSIMQQKPWMMLMMASDARLITAPALLPVLLLLKLHSESQTSVTGNMSRGRVSTLYSTIITIIRCHKAALMCSCFKTNFPLNCSLYVAT